MITIYQCKPNKSVIILSTQHESYSIPASYKKGQNTLENVKKKPIQFFHIIQLNMVSTLLIK